MGLLTGDGAGSGWTLYPPLSNSTYNSGPAMDYTLFALHLAGISSLLGAINFITTIFNMRTPGMTLHKMPPVLSCGRCWLPPFCCCSPSRCSPVRSPC